MGPLTLSGLGSNLNVDAIIEKLVAVERRPIETINAASDKTKTRISVYGKLQSALSTLRDAASKLSQPDLWRAVQSSSSDPTVITATSAAGGSSGQYAVDVQRLASMQSVSSRMFSTDARLGGGSIRIELGSWDGDPPGFASKPENQPVSIQIRPGQDSLAEVRDAINASGAGVRASVVTDARGSRLVFRSAESGLANGFRITTVPDGGSASGSLADLAFDKAGGPSAMHEDLRAENAQVLVNGLMVQAASNQIDNVVDGVVLSALKLGAASVTTTPDLGAIKKALATFIESYNSVNTLLRDNTRYDAENRSAAPLQGDSVAVGTLNQLRRSISPAGPVDGAFGHMSDIGLKIGASGSLSTDDTKLNKALTRREDVRKLFVDAGAEASGGIASQVRRLVDQLTSIDGALSVRTGTLQEQLRSNDKRIDALEDRARTVEKRLRDRYTALDKSMAEFSRSAGVFG